MDFFGAGRSNVEARTEEKHAKVFMALQTFIQHSFSWRFEASFKGNWVLS